MPEELKSCPWPVKWISLLELKEMYRKEEGDDEIIHYEYIKMWEPKKQGNDTPKEEK